MSQHRENWQLSVIHCCTIVVVRRQDFPLLFLFVGVCARLMPCVFLYIYLCRINEFNILGNATETTKEREKTARPNFYRANYFCVRRLYLFVCECKKNTIWCDFLDNNDRKWRRDIEARWMKICSRMRINQQLKTDESITTKMYEFVCCYHIIAILEWNFMGADLVEPNISCWFWNCFLCPQFSVCSDITTKAEK